MYKISIYINKLSINVFFNFCIVDIWNYHIKKLFKFISQYHEYNDVIYDRLLTMKLLIQIIY